MLDLEEPLSFDDMPRGGRRGAIVPPPPPPPPSETFYAISAVGGEVASSEADGSRATFVH